MQTVKQTIEEAKNSKLVFGNDYQLYTDYLYQFTNGLVTPVTQSQWENL